MGLVDGTPTHTTQETVQWEGMGSIQYVRSEALKGFADERGGTAEQPTAIECFLPYEAMPDEGMAVVDVDGVLGTVGAYLTQNRAPANVGGADVHWQLYLGESGND